MTRRKKWDPTCSFCGSRVVEGLVRAGSKDYWICKGCVEQPTVEDSILAGTRCTFCEELLSGTRVVVAAKRGTVLCVECLDICVRILLEDQFFKAKPLC